MVESIYSPKGQLVVPWAGEHQQLAVPKCELPTQSIAALCPGASDGGRSVFQQQRGILKVIFKKCFCFVLFLTL